MGSPAGRLEDHREDWQARAIAHTRYDPYGMVVLSVLAHNFEDQLLLWLHSVFPGFRSITTPFLCSAGKINKRGEIIADVLWVDYHPVTKSEVIFASERGLETYFRRLADRLKLSDAERIELFVAVRRWVVADMRLDPTMDPRDPDARRLN